MSKSRVEASYTGFSAGMVGDSNPLSPAKDSTLYEKNLELNLDRSRSRRQGMQAEGNQVVLSGLGAINLNETINTYSWNSPGGVDGLIFLVVMFGTKLQVVSTAVLPYSDGVLYTHDVGTGPSQLSVTSVDGSLVIANGRTTVGVLEFQAPNTFTYTEKALLVRDFFGVEDINPTTSEDLTEGATVARRPTISDLSGTSLYRHVYNLRNQSWGKSYYSNRVHDMVDPLKEWISFYPSLLPSNADDVKVGVAKDPVSSKPLLDALKADFVYSTPPELTKAPSGHFIINALSRGASRVSEYLKGMANVPVSGGWLYPSLTIPLDSTSIGASVVSEYSGRVFFAGFGNLVTDGDDKSPNLASYVLFSRTVNNSDDIIRCYQKNDPTSLESPDLLDTDGGFIRISGCGKIVNLFDIGKGLAVVATNGVWVISGGTTQGFSATAFIIDKVTEKGCISPNSCVVVENTLMYWADDGIYAVGSNEVGSFVAKPVTKQVISNFYNSISTKEKVTAKGSYDKYQGRVGWLYNNSLDATGPTKELVYDTNFSAFTYNEIGGDGSPRVCSSVVSPPYKVITVTEPVTYNAAVVEYNTDPVTYSSYELVYTELTSVLYVSCYSQGSGSISWGFTSYGNQNFIDFEETGAGVDAEAMLISGYAHGEDIARQKQAPTLNVFLEKTEEGFEIDPVTGDATSIIHESSCMVQAQWDWSITGSGGKWSNPFQAYRQPRTYVSDGTSTDTFDTGDSVIVTRNKCPGRGRTLSLKMYSEPLKDLRLLGWSLTMDVNNAK